MVAVKAQIPMSGTLIQEAALNAEIIRLGKEAPHAATDEVIDPSRTSEIFSTESKRYKNHAKGIR